MATQRRRAGQANAQKALFGGKGKIQNTGNAKVDAKRQTLNDRQDYKKNRAKGDNEMAGRALSGADPEHGFGNDKRTKNGKDLITLDKFGKAGSNVYGGGGGKGIEKPSQIPNKVRKKTPAALQDRQKELDDLKKMEGIDELKKKKGKRT